MGKLVAFPGRLRAVSGGTASYPQCVSHYDDDVYDDDEGGQSPPSYPPIVDDQSTFAALCAEMVGTLQRWGVCDAKRILRDSDPVAVAWAITSVEDALATGEVRNAGGLFRWTLRNGCNGL